MQPGTWYEATAGAPPATDPPQAVAGAEVDVAIIGGGLAGLWLAGALARAGARVACLEAGAIGAGASGRNGGFCSAGWACGARDLVALVGPSVRNGWLEADVSTAVGNLMTAATTADALSEAMTLGAFECGTLGLFARTARGGTLRVVGKSDGGLTLPA
ncbi:MAG: FAD-dependent oxidoreductase, partial [Gemmobacter sp.]